MTLQNIKISCKLLFSFQFSFIFVHSNLRTSFTINHVEIWRCYIGRDCVPYITLLGIQYISCMGKWLIHKWCCEEQWGHWLCLIDNRAVKLISILGFTELAYQCGWEDNWDVCRNRASRHWCLVLAYFDIVRVSCISWLHFLIFFNGIYPAILVVAICTSCHCNWIAPTVPWDRMTHPACILI